MKNLIVSLILLFFISPFIYSQSAEQDCEKGNYMLSLGKFGTAVQYFNKALSEKSDYAEAYFGMGKAYDSQGEFEEAIKDYSKAIDLKPDYVEALNNRGKIYTNPLYPAYKSTAEQGMKDYDRALEISPTNGDTYYLRGAAYLFVYSDREKSLENENKAIEYNPKLKEAYNLRANLYSMNTIKLLFRLIQDNAQESDIKNLINDSLKAELQKGKDDATKAINIDPSYSSPYVTRAAINMIFGDYKSSVADYESALTIGVDPTIQKLIERNLEFAQSKANNQ